MPQSDPRDGFRFVMDGEPWFPAGYYPRLGTQIRQAPGQDLRKFCLALHDSLSANGLNYYRALFTFGQPYIEPSNETWPFLRSNVPGAADGGNRFDLDKFNDAHFSYWRELIKDAQAKGIVVQLCILDSWHNKRFKSKPKEWDLKYDFYAGGNNVNGLRVATEDEWHSTDPNSLVWKRHTAFVREVVGRLGDLPNIIWEISNEPKPYYDGRDAPVPGKTTNNWAVQLGRYLKDYEKATHGHNHLCMGVDLPDHQHVAGQRPDWFVTPQVEKDGHTPAGAHRDLVGQVKSMKAPQPLICDNDAARSYLSPEGQRQKAWAVLTAGAHMDFFHFEMFDLATLQSGEVAEAMRYVGQTTRFIREFSVNLRGMKPSDELVSNGWCLARPPEEYVIYLVHGGSTKVSGLPDGYSAKWFNPRDGGHLPAGTGPAFAAPDGDDWVLYIRR